jgi:hypothetical protein
MSRRLVYGRYTDTGNRALAKWVAKRIPYVDESPLDPFGPAECVGVYEGRRLIAAVVFHAWDPATKTMMASMAADTPMWAKPKTIGEILAVPFEMCGVRKLYTLIRMDNTRVIKLNKHLGFREEGRLSEHYGPSLHAMILGLKSRFYFSQVKKRFSEERIKRAAGA